MRRSSSHCFIIQTCLGGLVLQSSVCQLLSSHREFPFPNQGSSKPFIQFAAPGGHLWFTQGLTRTQKKKNPLMRHLPQQVDDSPVII